MYIKERLIREFITMRSDALVERPLVRFWHWLKKIQHTIIEKRRDRRTQAQSALFIELGSYIFPIFSFYSMDLEYSFETLQAILSQCWNVLLSELYFYWRTNNLKSTCIVRETFKNNNKYTMNIRFNIFMKKIMSSIFLKFQLIIQKM